MKQQMKSAQMLLLVDLYLGLLKGDDGLER